MNDGASTDAEPCYSEKNKKLKKKLLKTLKKAAEAEANPLRQSLSGLSLSPLTDYGCQHCSGAIHGKYELVL